MTRAVVDVGSNSVLLLVARQSGARWETLYESSRVTGLGAGTKTTGLLQEPGMTETLDALREAKKQAEAHGATEFIAAATMAARIATNTSVFAERAAAQNTPIVVLSGEDEAELGFQAVASDPLFAGEKRISIVDPGGHSTELLTADAVWHQPAGAVEATAHWSVRYRNSFPVGALGLREKWLSAPAPDFMARLRAAQHLDELIGLAYRPAESGLVVALGATGTNLVSIREKLTSWQPEKVHGATLDYEEISRAAAWMMDMDDTGRAAIVGIEPGREKTIHIGCLILERFLYALRAGSCRVSVRGWRHALLEQGLPSQRIANQ